MSFLVVVCVFLIRILVSSKCSVTVPDSFSPGSYLGPR